MTSSKKELTTTEYLEAMDLLDAKKDRIAYFDMVARTNTLAINAQTRNIEATIEVFLHGDNSPRVKQMREELAAKMKVLDKKFGKKYWEGVAAQVGIPWIV